MPSENLTVTDASALSVPTTRTLLQNIPMFAGLSKDHLVQLAKVAAIRQIPKHVTIIHVGAQTDSVFVLLRGSVKVLNRDAEGREVILSILGVGECFGEMGLIDDAPRSADVVTAEACDLLIISRAGFKEVLSENVELCLGIMKSLVLRLRDANRKIESLALMDVYGRVARQLLDLSGAENGERIVKQRVTKQDMAKMVGASREMVSRVMRDLEHNGAIRYEDGRIVLK